MESKSDTGKSNKIPTEKENVELAPLSEKVNQEDSGQIQREFRKLKAMVSVLD